MAGLLGDSWDDPRTMATLQMAAGLLSGGNFGQALGRGLSGYSDSMSASQKDAFVKEQMQWKRDEMAREDATRAEEKRQRDLLRGLFAPASGSQAIGVDGRGPTPDKVPLIGQLPKIDYQALLAQGVSLDKVKALADAQNFGRDEVARVVEEMGPNGEKVQVQYDKFGRKVSSSNGYIAPVQVNQGDRITFTTPAAGASFKMGMSPSERDASARGWASNRIQRDRLAWEQTGGGADGASQAGLVKMFGKPQPGFRWKNDGSLEPIPGGPADQKAQTQDAGRDQLSTLLAEMRGMYDTLDNNGAITSTSNRAGTNFGAWLSATGVGQGVGSMFGTESQSARDKVAQSRPLLMQAIMKATGMSAKQMDSNTELKLMLATATDPKMGLEANRAALDRLETMFGRGGERKLGMQELPPANQHKGKTIRDSETGELLVSDGMTWKKKGQ